MNKILLSFVLMHLCVFGAYAQNNFERSVYFDKDKAELRPQDEPTLIEVMDFLNKNPAFQIQLTGTTDADGKDDHNRLLSENRVQTIRQFLEKKGIPSSKIATLALGKVQTIADNATEEAKKQNRRVNIQVRLPQNTSSVAITQKPIGTKKTGDLGSLYRELATPIQTFKIQTNRDTTIRGEKGTVLFIPKNAFAGVPYGAIVDFKLKEDYSYSDMVRDNLNTMSGDKILQTGGMIYTEASYKAQQLEFQENLNVQFNSKESQLEGMQLFSGERNMKQNGSINWTPLSNKNEKEEITTIFAAPNGAFSPYLILNEKNNKPITLQELCDTSGCYPLLIRESVRNGFSVRPNMTNVCGAMAMFLNARPSISPNTPVETIHKMAFPDAYELYNVVNLSDLKSQNSAKWDTMMAIRAKRIDVWETGEIKRQKQKDQIERLGRIFPFSRPGWLNCDAYEPNTSQLASTKMVSNLEISSDSYGMCTLISKSRPAVIRNTLFSNKKEISNFVSINGAFWIVVIVIDKEVSYLAISNGIGENDDAITLDFKKTSPNEIKERLKILDR